ncbi:MAG: CHAT domain-containing protein [Bacteroidales bacterium]|nr:CHAT domain-containing protein [Bacteroidales bacterium]
MVKFFLFIFLLIFSNLNTYCQQYKIISSNQYEEKPDTLQTRELNELAKNLILESIENYEQLLYSRAVPSEEDFISEDLNISDVLKTVYGEDKVGYILYSYNDGILTSVLFDAIGIRANKQVEIKKENLLELPQLVQSSMAITKLISERSPKSRGAEVVAQSEQVDLPTLSKCIFDILLFDESLILKYDHLIISPVFNIASIPFYCLRFLGTEAFFIDSLSYSIAPRLFDETIFSEDKNAALAELLNSSSNYTKADLNGLGSSMEIQFTFEDPLFVGNPAYPTTDEYTFPDLPGAAEEVQYAYNFAGKGTLLLKDEATKENVLKSIEEHDLLYFATHGMNDPDNALDKSYLVLTPDTNGRNYALTAREVQYLKLNADLTILSSCQSGLGLAHEGGTIGMARAFQIAGVNHVIMSLWNVNDYYTKELMKQFLTNISTKGYKFFPAEPLRDALLQIKEQEPGKPEYWSSFTVFGNPY